VRPHVHIVARVWRYDVTTLSLRDYGQSVSRGSSSTEAVAKHYMERINRRRNRDKQP
jgi:hypothetical protein